MVKRKYSQTGTVVRKRARLSARALAAGAVARSRYIGRRKNRARLSRVLPSRNVHYFKRWAQSNSVLAGSTADGAGYAEAFTFNQLPNYSEFDTLYDRYMLCTVILKVQLIQNPYATYYTNNTTLINAANYFPKFWYYSDNDDNTAPSSLDEVKQHAKAKHFVLQPNKEYTIVCRPAVNIQTYRTSTTTGYSPKWNQWIDIAQVDVPHYGLKYFIETMGIDPTDTQRPSVRIERLFYFKCKDVR